MVKIFCGFVVKFVLVEVVKSLAKHALKNKLFLLKI